MPLYGLRRRHKEKLGHIMPDVNNLIAMGSHCIEETRALTHLLYDTGFRLMTIAGISLGGCVTNMTVANIRLPIASVAMFPGHSIDAFFVDGCLKTNCAWEKVFKEVGEKHAPDCEKTFVQRDVMSKLTSLASFKRPDAADCSIQVSAMHDNYISYKSALKIKEIWKDCHMRYVYGGHTLGFLLHTHKLADCVEESLTMLRERHYKSV